MQRKLVRRCIRCGCEIDKCNGFVLARDIVNHRKQPRELCGKCALMIGFDELEELCAGVAQSVEHCVANAKVVGS